MPALQVRDFPEELYEELRVYARANHRSIAQQTIIAVDRMIHGRAGGSNQESDSDSPAIYNFETEQRRGEIKAKKLALLDEIHRMNEEHPLPAMAQEEHDAILRESRYELEHRHDSLLTDLDIEKEGAACL